MSTSENQALSEFGQAAMVLENEMREFERLGYQLENLTLESDKGMSRCGEILEGLNACRERMETGMREMSRTLGEARERNEKVEQTIALRTQIWRERCTEAERLTARLKTLGDSVHYLNAKVAEFRQPFPEEISPEEEGNIRSQLTQAMEPLTVLVEEAKKIAKDAQSANMQGLERNADTLRQTLQSTLNRINLLAKRGTHPSN